jgi:hypothetical protein
VRELHEEAGLSDKPFRLGYFKKRLPTESENVMVYCVVASKKPKLLKEEVVSGSFKTLPEVEELVKAKKFIPETRDLLPILRKHLKKRFNN